MGTLYDVHVWFAWVTLGLNVGAGAWALAAHWRAELRSRAMWWLVLVAEAAIAVQVLLGSALVIFQDWNVPDFHAFYGYATLISVGIIYAYRSQLRARKYLLYGLGGLFLSGMIIRSMIVG